MVRGVHTKRLWTQRNVEDAVHVGIVGMLMGI